MFDRVTVRMYEMGFGDCFLVTFWNANEGKSVLFDCGSLSRPKAEIAKVAQDVVAACTTDGKARLELVVCTHRHKDHVNGFDNPIWANVEVGEVWLPWTENTKDPVATRIRNRQSNLALSLCKSLKADLSSEDMPLAAGLKDTASAVLTLALNALTNEKAMSTLHGGFAGRPPRMFLPDANGTAEPKTVTGLPGVKFHVLGPSRSEDVIKAMDPPAGAAYLHLAPVEDGQNKPAKPYGACAEKWRVSEEEFYKCRREPSAFTEKDKAAVDELADEPDGDLAAAIDQAVNNTSLVLMIEVGDQFLLFPGDAQWGTWKAILDDPDQQSLLQRTTMLKVSHHGSHNGTPKELVERILRKGTVALVSTAAVKQWPDVPRPPLMTALSGKAVLARSDQAAALKRKKGFTVVNGYIEWEGPIAS